MKKNSQEASQGFTIIEVLIVFAAMGFLLYEAINFISSDTQKASFTVAVNSFKQQMEQLINETSNGYYPSNNNFTCTGYTDSSTPPTFASGSTNQGQNTGCIFLGKIIQFNSSSSQFSTYPIVGNEFVSTANGPQSPTKIYDTTSGASPTLPTLNTTSGLSGVTTNIENGLTINYVRAVDASSMMTQSTAAVGFLAGDASGTISSYSGTGLNNGPEPLSLYYDSQSPLKTTAAFQFQNLNSDVTHPGGLMAASEMDICVSNGGNGSGLIKIGGSGSLSVTASTFSDGTC